MATSQYPKTQSIIRNVGTGQSAQAGASREIRIPLNRDMLTSEQQVNISVVQGNTAALGTPPSDLSLHVARLVESIAVETDQGSIIIGDGQSIVASMSFTEQQPVPKFNDVAGTAQFTIDLHHENDGALHDLLTAMETGTLSKYDLVVRLADPAVVGVFAAGAGGAGAPTYTVRVNAVSYPALTGLGAYTEVEVSDPNTGDAYMAQNSHVGIGSLVHRIRTQTIKPNGAGAENFILMSVGNILRFAQLIVIDPATGMPVNGALGSVRLVVAGEEIRNLNFDEIQASNESKRNFVHNGIAVIDFGDDEDGFLDLGAVADARLFVEVLAGAPANVEIRLTEDYTAQA